MIHKKLKVSKSWLLGGCAIAGAFVVATQMPRVQGSDHGDTAQNYNGGNSGADLTDLYVFPAPSNARNVVFVMNVHGLIPAGQSRSVGFDPNVLYQFKIDTTGDNVEDSVMQFKFSGTAPNQTVQVSGPVKPSKTGTTSVQETPYAVTGKTNVAFTPTAGMKVFAGPRQDSFFFDLEQFYKLLPDRSTPIQPPQPRSTDINTPNPNSPTGLSWRPPGQAKDYLANLNVLSIVVEMPRTAITLPS